MLEGERRGKKQAAEKVNIGEEKINETKEQGDKCRRNREEKEKEAEREGK